MACAVNRANGFTGYYGDVHGKRLSAGVYPTKEEAVIRARDLEGLPPVEWEQGRHRGREVVCVAPRSRTQLLWGPTGEAERRSLQDGRHAREAAIAMLTAAYAEQFEALNGAAPLALETELVGYAEPEVMSGPDPRWRNVREWSGSRGRRRHLHRERIPRH